MCGIHGMLNLTGAPVDPALLSAMGRVTRHRGPDDEGHHVDGACGIAMRRLSIIDLAGGHQPISSADDTVWVVCNGEIYNFRELRRELEAHGHTFKTRSDTEVLLCAYAEFGDAFVSRLNGMFGFALWDARRRRLLIGRDRLGIKPIYLAESGTRIAFASEAKALFALPDLRPELDPAALDSYLQLGYVPAPLSIFRGITKLPPATLMIIENGTVERREYWRLPAGVDSGIPEDEWVERVRERMLESVRMQMVADVPLGAFLSGGLDSSSVVACMSQASNQPLKTYAIGFSGGPAEQLYNELPYARRVARLFGTEHHEILVRPDVVELLPKLAWHMDEPIADTAFLTTFLVSEFARREVKVILSGVGGDELFGGYRRYLGDHYQAYLARLPGWLRRAAVAAGNKLPADRHSPLLNYARLAKGFLAATDLPFEERYRSYVQVFLREEIEALAQPNGANGHDAAGRRLRALELPGQSESDARRRRGDPAARRPAAAHGQDDHGHVARMPSSALGSRAGRAGRTHARERQGPGRPPQARDEAGRGRFPPRRHPVAQEARLRHADGRLVEERAQAAPASPALRRGGRCPWLVSAYADPASDRGSRGEPRRRHRPLAGAGPSRGLGATVPRWSHAARPGSGAEGSGRMKILYVCHRFPYPPKRGGKIRPFHTIRHFSRSHEVTVCSLARSRAEAEEGRGIAPFCKRFEMELVDRRLQVLRMVACLASSRPSSMGFFHSAHLARRIRALLAAERFDLIFVHCSSVAPYVAAVRGVPKILDFGDMDSQKWLSYAHHKPFPLSLGYRLEGTKLERAERRLAGQFDLCTATTRAEWDTLESYGTGIPTDWFPNGVDSEYFSPVDEPYEPDTISFVGRMDYYPNQECMFDFCRNAWPVVRQRRPSARLLIVGADPSRAVQRLAEIPGVTVTGSVADVRPYLHRSAVMVAPLHIARGTQNKILESLAAGVPVVTSPVAAGGVDAQDGEHLLVAKTAADCAAAVLRILDDPSERRRLAQAGRRRMLSHHSWSHSMQRLDGIVERCSAGFRQSRLAAVEGGPS